MALSVKIDWNKDGDYSDTGETVTTRVMASPGVSVEYGRDQSTALAPLVAGRGGFTLNNASGDYNPLNTSSPIYGLIKPARPVEIKRTVGGNTYTLFIGHTDDTPLNPDLSARTVSVSVLDYLADFRGQNVTTEVYSGIRTGAAIDILLDELGWPSALRDIDPGVTIIPWWFEAGTDAMEALDKILRSEGPPALLTIGSSGEIVFKDRHHRLLDAASTTSQDTWYGDRSTGTPEMMTPFVYDAGWRNIVNHGGEEVNVYTVSGLGVVWTSETPITLAADEIKIITATVPNPVVSMFVDITVASGSIAATPLVNSGTSIPIELYATSAAVMTSLQIRATTLETAYTVQVSAQDTESIDDYGKRTFPTDLPLCNQYDAEAVLSTAVALRAQPLAIITASIAVPPSDTAVADAVLERDMSDRVTVQVDAMDLDADFYIESFKHDFGTELDHVVTFGCEEVPAAQATPLQFDLAGSGFDDGTFATGLATSATMFILDSSTSGQRFNEGLFCT